MADRDMVTFTPRGQEVRVVADLVFVYVRERLAGYGLAKPTSFTVDWLREPSTCERDRGVAETAALALIWRRAVGAPAAPAIA